MKCYKKKTDDRNNWKKHDSEFHQVLVQNCGSKNLIELHKLIFDKYLRYQLLILTFRGSKSVQEHQDILDFTLGKNYEKAQFVLKTHITNGIDHALQNFKLD